MSMHFFPRALCALAASLVLAGCSLAPVHQRPQAPIPAHWPQQDSAPVLSSSAATLRRTMSRSVTTPRSRPSAVQTGRQPTLFRLSARAATETGSPAPTEMTCFVMQSFTRILAS